MAKCARADCGKTVYPMEELKCLDQTWHKQCFRCGNCNMVLNLKNYKGYNKIPYCDAHYPKTTATVVADTPEMRRLQEATKIQSQVKYHEDFEKMKGKKLDVVDDPELQRVMKNSQIQSNVSYHGEVERKELMEKVRPTQQELEQARLEAPFASTAAVTAPGAAPVPMSATKAASVLHQQQISAALAGRSEQQAQIGKPTTPYSAKMQQSPTLIYSSEQGGRVQPQGRPVGSIADYDPINGQWGTIASLGPNRQNQSAIGPGQKYAPAMSIQQQQQHQQQQLNSPTSPGRGIGQRGPQQVSQGIVYRAMYDYTAADNDEVCNYFTAFWPKVSFKEGDMIINCQQVDSGWMTGTVKRTGKWGMLPANYVERVH